jgi:dTDP-4-amino-4,6-dideoxygalactose transaminase
VPHPYAFFHDETAWNFRLPNLNAALGCAQMEQLADILADKRAVAAAYKAFFADMPGLRFVDEPAGCRSNFWLNAVLLEDRRCRTSCWNTPTRGVMCRPLWTPLPDLPMYSGCYTDGVAAGRGLADRLVNLPSGPRRAAHAPAL